MPEHEGPIAGIALDGRFLGWLLLADSVRAEAAEALADLRELGLGRQLLLTGDRRAVADAVAKQVGIRQLVAQALPEDKLRQVGAEIGSGFRPMVVGDGINDSLALKAGVVGVAMGAGGADIALASADIVLIGSDLRRLGTCVRLSRQCRRTLQVNVAIGLGWTLAIVAAAAFGLLGAAGAMVAARCTTSAPCWCWAMPDACCVSRSPSGSPGRPWRDAKRRVHREAGANATQRLALAGPGGRHAVRAEPGRGVDGALAGGLAGQRPARRAARPGRCRPAPARAVKLQADGSQALVMEVTRMPLQSGQAVNLEKVLGHMRKLVQIEFLRNGLQTACTSPQPSTTGGLAALETAPFASARAVVMKQTLLAAAGKTSAYSLSYAGLAEAYDASQAEIRAVRESLRFE